MAKIRNVEIGKRGRTVPGNGLFRASLSRIELVRPLRIHSTAVDGRAIGRVCRVILQPMDLATSVRR